MRTTSKNILFLSLIIFISTSQVNATAPTDDDIKTKMHNACEKIKVIKAKFQKLRADMDEIIDSVEKSHVELNQIKDSDVFKENTKQGMRQTD